MKCHRKARGAPLQSSRYGVGVLLQLALVGLLYYPGRNSLRCLRSVKHPRGCVLDPVRLLAVTTVSCALFLLLASFARAKSSAIGRPIVRHLWQAVNVSRTDCEGGSEDGL